MKPFRKCPVRGQSEEAELLYQQEFAVPDAYEGIPALYPIVACTLCGAVYSDVDASQEIYDRYYERNSKYENLGRTAPGTIDKGLVNAFRGIVQTFKEYVSPHGSVLDIGCATGGMLCALKEEGFCDLTGLDMSEACVEHVRSMGIACQKGGIFTKDLNFNKKFDLIVMTQVLEHIYDVRAAMNNVRSMLKDGGMLYMDVPDAGRYHSHYIKPFYYFDMEHINHFDRQALINVGAAAGFQNMMAWEKETYVGWHHTYPVAGVLHQKIQDNEKEACLVKCQNSSVKQYIAIAQSAFDRHEEAISGWIEQEKPIIVWGGGAFSLSYLKKGLEKCRIEAIVDNDIKKQGLIIGSIKVKAPDIIYGSSALIVVVAALNQSVICEQITQMGLTNEVYCI